MPGPSDHESAASEPGLEPSLEQLMQQLARPPETGPSSPGGSRSSSAQLGDVLAGRYRLTGLLGGGGMGIVYAAQHVHTGREVAVKLLRTEGERDKSWDERVQRFVREATAAGRVKHPNVVDVYDVDLHQGTPFLVMERLNGESLRQRLKRGPLPSDLAFEVMRGAMSGVAEVHRKAVIHRDLKPDNIFLAQVIDERGETQVVPKVLDFGVSRVLSLRDGELKPTTLTREGSMLGTPAYMALEQLRGERNVDARVDVYALGVILYECLSGRRPYPCHNGHDLVARMLTEAPVPLRKHAPHLSEYAEAAIMRALAHAPNDRYPSVESFDLALANVKSRPSARLQHFKRGALGLSLGAVFAAALLFAYDRTAPVAHRSPPPPPTFVPPARAALSPAGSSARLDDTTRSAAQVARFAGAGAHEPAPSLDLAGASLGNADRARPPARALAKTHHRRRIANEPQSAPPVDHATLLLPNDF